MGFFLLKREIFFKIWNNQSKKSSLPFCHYGNICPNSCKIYQSHIINLSILFDNFVKYNICT